MRRSLEPADHAGDRDDRPAGRADRRLGAADRCSARCKDDRLRRRLLGAAVDRLDVHPAAAGRRGAVPDPLDQGHQPHPPAVELHRQRHARAEIADRLDEALPANAQPPPGEPAGAGRLPPLHARRPGAARPPDQPDARRRPAGRRAPRRRGRRRGAGRPAARLRGGGVHELPRAGRHGPPRPAAVHRSRAGGSTWTSSSAT